MPVVTRRCFCGGLVSLPWWSAAATARDDRAADADGAVLAALKQAMAASNALTFPVGGILLHNATGTVLHANPNRVMRALPGGKTATRDPTAHGERQLVSWYYENKEKLGLPEPRELTVVTSLDPCAMCAGALLAAGFHVGVGAFDGWSGINYRKDGRFTTLPADLARQARETFGYYRAGQEGQDPPLYVRPYQGAPGLVFADSAMRAETYMGCGAIFTAGLGAVQAAKGNDGGPPDTLSDPYDLPDNSPIKTIYRDIYPNAFTVKVPDWRRNRTPDEAVRRELERAGGNAAAFIDPFGNLVLCLGDGNGIDTAFMRVARAYAERRFGLRETDADSLRYLTQPSYGAFVHLDAPDPRDAKTIMAFGAYGSSMAGPIPAGYERNFLYYRLPAGVTQTDLDDAIAALPPFYNQTVRMTLTRVGA